MNNHYHLSFRDKYDELCDAIRNNWFPIILHDVTTTYDMSNIHAALDKRGLRGKYRLSRNGNEIYVSKPKETR